MFVEARLEKIMKNKSTRERSTGKVSSTCVPLVSLLVGKTILKKNDYLVVCFVYST